MMPPDFLSMFGFSIRRLNRAKAELDKVEREKQLARETLKLEGQIAIGREQIKLMETMQQKLINAEIKGMNDGLKKTLPTLLESRQQAGHSQISGYLQSVKERASK